MNPRFAGIYPAEGLIAWGFVLLLTVASVFAHSTTTHRTLAEYAAQNSLSLPAPVNLTATQRSLIEKGADDEDYGIRSVNHAYNPASGGSFPTGVTAKDAIFARWSAMIAAFENGSLYGGDESGAWHYLGRASHLMQDMTSPLHSFAVEHLGIYGVSESCKFEAYWASQDATLRSMISNTGMPLHSSVLDSKATERLDLFSITRLQDRFENNSPYKELDDPRGWVEAMVWPTYFRATFWGQIGMASSRGNGAATTSMTAATTFSDGWVGAQVNVLDTMFGSGNVRWINNFIGDDYYEITDRNGSVFRWMSATDIDDWSSCGRFWGSGQSDSSARISGSDDDSDGVRITGRFWFDLREIGKRTSGAANRYCYPPYYPNGSSMTEHLHQYFGNHLYPLVVRYNASLLGLANRRVILKTADSAEATGFAFGRADNFGNGASPMTIGAGGAAFFFVAKSPVTLTAAALNTRGMPFVRWLQDGVAFLGNTSRTITINTSSNWIPENGVTFAAQYETSAPVTVQTSPPGLSFTVDGSTYSKSETFDWVPGSSHTIATASEQSGTSGVRFLYAGWNDGGGIFHVVTPTNATTYTAAFTTQFYIAMNAGVGGTVSPSNGWYDSGSRVPISATPKPGYGFAGWSGNGGGAYSGINNPASIIVSGPITQNGLFVTLTLPPALLISFQGDELVISWPTNDPRFSLFYAATYPATTWISNSVPPSVFNGQFTIRSDMKNRMRFYQLKK